MVFKGFSKVRKPLGKQKPGSALSETYSEMGSSQGYLEKCSRLLFAEHSVVKKKKFFFEKYTILLLSAVSLSTVTHTTGLTWKIPEKERERE